MAGGKTGRCIGCLVGHISTQENISWAIKTDRPTESEWRYNAWDIEEDGHLFPSQLVPGQATCPESSWAFRVFSIYWTCFTPASCTPIPLRIRLIQATPRHAWQHYIPKWALSHTGKSREESTGSGTRPWKQMDGFTSVVWVIGA
jgi:hypothetical protein